MDPETIEAFIRSTAEAERENDESFNKMADTKDKLGLEDTMAYNKKFIFDGVQIERSSPLEALQKQLRGYNMSGIYHVGIRDNNMNLFKLQHMAWRVPADSHVGAKYNLVERQMMDALWSMASIYGLRDKANEVIFRAGDYRSTLDTNLQVVPTFDASVLAGEATGAQG